MLLTLLSPKNVQRRLDRAGTNAATGIPNGMPVDISGAQFDRWGRPVSLPITVSNLRWPFSPLRFGAAPFVVGRGARAAAGGLSFSAAYTLYDSGTVDNSQASDVAKNKRWPSQADVITRLPTPVSLRWTTVVPNKPIKSNGFLVALQVRPKPPAPKPPPATQYDVTYGAPVSVPVDNYVDVSDSGTAVESLEISAAVPTSDAGSGVESVDIGVTLSTSDTGTGTESPSVSASLDLSDTGSGAESTPDVSATLTCTDIGTGSESTPSVGATLTCTDIASGVEDASCSCVCGLADSGTAVESLDIAITAAASTGYIGRSGGHGYRVALTYFEEQRTKDRIEKYLRERRARKEQRRLEREKYEAKPEPTPEAQKPKPESVVQKKPAPKPQAPVKFWKPQPPSPLAKKLVEVGKQYLKYKASKAIKEWIEKNLLD